MYYLQARLFITALQISQAFIPYDRLIHKKKILDFISPLAEHLKQHIGIWLLGKPDRDISLHC